MGKNGPHKSMVALGAALIGICSVCWGRTIYVDAVAGGTGDGSSWPNACRHLQDALAAAAGADQPVEIRVAQGVYKPDRGTGFTPGDRDATFSLLNGVTLQGGYAGVAGAEPNARDIKLYETILSGDLKDDDVEVKDPNTFFGPRNEPTRAENSLHVVTARGTDETAVLDGFVITAGCTFTPASLTQDEGIYGAGLFNDAAGTTVRQCVFRDNVSAVAGGAVYNYDGKPVFSDCVFEHNVGGSRGGAMYTRNSNLTVTGCTFAENTAVSWGGALMNSENTVASLKGCTLRANQASAGGAIYSGPANVVNLEDCTFEGNRATSLGEGGAISGMATLTLTHCTFHQNSARQIGGALHASGGTLHVSDCTFANNTVGIAGMTNGVGGALGLQWDITVIIADSMFENNAAPKGGAVYSSPAHVKITGCRFRHNTAFVPDAGSFWHSGGGAILASSSTMQLEDCDFQGNRSADAGGAIESGPAGGLVLTNCVFAGNRAAHAGAIHTTERDLRLENCTLASNLDADGFTLLNSAVLEHCIVWDGNTLVSSEYNLIATYCDVQGGYPGHGNMDMDPLFVRPGRWVDAQDPNLPAGSDDPNAVWRTGDYHLQSQAGHWDEISASWVCDGLTSPCIDAGDFDRPTGCEPFPNGGLVNLGAYGGTAEASKSYFGAPACQTALPGDLNGDCQVDITDAVLASQDWRQDPNRPLNLPPAIVITEPADGAVIEVSPANPEILIVADATDPDGFVREVWFSIAEGPEYGFRCGMTAFDEGADGWCGRWKFLDPANPYAPGQYTITAYAIDDDCEIAFAPQVHITVTVTE
jgi:predicted outer membrane repeat protein